MTGVEPVSDPIIKQPVSLGEPPGTTPVNGVSVRKLRDTQQDAEFAAKLQIEGFRTELTHAVGTHNLPTLCLNIIKYYRGQPAAFYDNVFVAEYIGIPVGLTQLKFYKDKWKQPSDHLCEMGCRALCGLFCFGLAVDETVPAGKCLLECLCVEASHRGKGIGNLLMQRTEYEARARNCTSLYLVVVSTNRAKNLYQRSGLEVTSEETCCGCLRFTTGVRSYYYMEKRLV